MREVVLISLSSHYLCNIRVNASILTVWCNTIRMNQSFEITQTPVLISMSRNSLNPSGIYNSMLVHSGNIYIVIIFKQHVIIV